MVGEQNRVWLFYCFNFDRNYDVLKWNTRWTKIQFLIKIKRNEKWKLPHTPLERRSLCFGSYKIHELKVKLWWARAREREKDSFFCNVYFVTFILSFKTFFNYLCFSSMYSVLNKLLEYIYTFTYQKIISVTSYTFMSVFKIAKSLQCILKRVLYLIKLQTDPL